MRRQGVLQPRLRALVLDDDAAAARDGTADSSVASARNAASISAYEKLAFLPLGLGSTNNRAPSNRSSCRPKGDGSRFSRFLMGRSSLAPPTRRLPSALLLLLLPHTARYTVTPTNATTSGFHRRTFRRSTRSPASYSSGRRESMPGVARGMTLVIPSPQSGKRSSSWLRSGSGTRPDSWSSFQNRLE